MLFARYGHSDGSANAPAHNAASAGFEFEFARSQAVAFGVGWAAPSAPGLRDEWVVETSYRVRITPELSLMPDVQLVLDPAANPGVGSIWIFSLRTIVAFYIVT